VIEDLEGATSEPNRRWHVAVLSAVIASLSLVVLALLVVPSARLGTAPAAASPSPSAGARRLTTMFAANPLVQLRVDLTHASQCPDGSRLTPPYYLAVDGETGRISAGRSDGTSLPVRVTFAFNAETGWINATCAGPSKVVTGDVLSPNTVFDEP
jgi:hypothetical protein